MKIALRHSIFIYITILSLALLFESCGNNEQKAPKPEGLTEAPKEQLDAIEERIRQIDPQARQKRRLKMNEAQGEAEVNYDKKGVLMEVSGEYKTSSGTQKDHFFFDEKGELTYSTHRIISEEKDGAKSILEQQFTYNQQQEVNAASQRYVIGADDDLKGFDNLKFEAIQPDMDAVNNQQKTLLSSYRTTLRF